MKLPSFKLLKKNDFKDEFQEMIETLAFSLNNGIEVLYDALSRRVNLRDNIACTVKDIDVEVDSTGVPKAQVTIKTDLTTRIEGTQIILVVNKTNSALSIPASSGTPFIIYEAVQTGINVKQIMGLYPDNKYTLRVVIYQQ